MAPTGEQSRPETQGRRQGDLLQRMCQVRDQIRDLLRDERLDSLGPGEKSAVNGIHDGLGGDLSSTEESAIEALDGVLATLNAVELQVDISLGTDI